MPYLTIRTNLSLDPDRRAAALRASSALVGEALGKPEDYVMVQLEEDQPMLFAGTDAPLALLQLKSIGLPEDRTKELSRILCEFAAEMLGVRPDRIYVEFQDARRTMWGWNGDTFA